MQQTLYVYGVKKDKDAKGNNISSNDLLREVHYPDPVTGRPSDKSADYEVYTYNALGQVKTFVDRNNVFHHFKYDALGRQAAEEIGLPLGSTETKDGTTITLSNGTSMDGTVRSTTTAFDQAGLPYLFTSYNKAGNVVNQVEREFDGYGNLDTEYQAHNGAVTSATAIPHVQYDFTYTAAGQYRLSSITYPKSSTGSSKVVFYDYTSALDDRISRLSFISDGKGASESYKYLGVGTVVERANPAVKLTYMTSSGAITGLDSFGRVADHLWKSASTTTDQFKYVYDPVGNILSKANHLNTAFSESYGYDAFDQLSDFRRANGHHQSWMDSALGNSANIITDGQGQSRSYDAQNRLLTIGSTTLSYDANGNQKVDDKGQWFKYDAWNRLAEVWSSSAATATLIAKYSYDALGRRIIENVSGGKFDLYYSKDWQVLQEVQGTVTMQYVWSPVYVNAMAWRDRYDGTKMVDRLYVQQDVNWNVTALVNTSGQVVQRFIYDPFGQDQILTANWTPTSDAYKWWYRFQGGRFETATGLYNFQRRDYSPTQGRWIEEDPIGIRGGDNNFYRFVGGNPVNHVDPSGQIVFVPILIWVGVGLFAAGAATYGYSVASEANPDSWWAIQNVTGWDNAPRLGKAIGKTMMATGTAMVAAPVFGWAAGLAYVGPWVQAGGAALAMNEIFNLTMESGRFRGDWIDYIDQFGPRIGAFGGGFASWRNVAAGYAMGQNVNWSGLLGRWGVGAPQTAMSIRFGPHMEGPLPAEVANTFRGGSYSRVTLEAETTVYRVWGGQGRELSPYWTRTPPQGPLQARIDLALNPQWGNTAQNVTTIRVPKGTVVYEGAAALQGGLVGGGNQVYIPRVEPSWVSSTSVGR